MDETLDTMLRWIVQMDDDSVHDTFRSDGDNKLYRKVREIDMYSIAKWAREIQAARRERVGG